MIFSATLNYLLVNVDRYEYVASCVKGLNPLVKWIFQCNRVFNSVTLALGLVCYCQSERLHPLIKFTMHDKKCTHILVIIT